MFTPFTIIRIPKNNNNNIKNINNKYKQIMAQHQRYCHRMTKDASLKQNGRLAAQVRSLQKQLGAAKNYINYQ